MRAFPLMLAIAIAAVACSATSSFAQQLAIIPLDSGYGNIPVQFNPTEISVKKTVPWEHKKRSVSDVPPLQFAGAEPATMSFELLFDTFETGEDVRAVYIDRLTALSKVGDENKRPPMVKVTWGAFPPFTGVIEDLSVSYVMFKPDGTPVRATCSVRMKEATSVSARGGATTIVQDCSVDADCPAGKYCNTGTCAPLH